MIKFALRIGILLGSFLFSNNGAFAAENVVSLAVGFSGINELVQQVQQQEKFGINSAQTRQLAELVSDKTLLADFRKTLETETLKGARFEAANLQATKVLDKVVQNKVRKILNQDQLDAIRQFHLRKRFPSPIRVFENTSLIELELEKTEIEDVLAITNPLIAESAKAHDKSLRKALAEIIEELSPVERSKLVMLTGNALFDKEPVQVVENPKSLEIIHESRPAWQLPHSLIMHLRLPQDQSLTALQLKELRRLFDIDAGRDAKNPGSNRDSLIRNELSEILTPSQYVALIQATHRQMLELDLNWLGRREVLSYMSLKEENATSLRKMIADHQVRISNACIESEKRIFETGIQSMSKIKGAYLQKLFKDVW